MEPTTPNPIDPQESLTPDQQIRRRTLKAFALFGLGAAVPYGVWKWLTTSPRSGGIPGPLREVLQANEQLAETYFRPASMAPTFPVERAVPSPRVNGWDGLKTPIPEDWSLQVRQPTGAQLSVSLDDIRALPRHEIVFEFKCIEGWSQIQHWAGARLSDFVAHYGLGTRTGRKAQSEADWYRYVGMETPDHGYYVGIDMPSALHPQTLLAYEMNNQPLTAPHGAPLRLIIPVKYGVKNLKRIGTIFFADEKPRDFWAERGYDYHVGL
ncbi:molybdopterin-dependent oxidoreductase [Tellurirhabdus rosea]|uniref:molybdopterin-dependent oxidoreductase n=1 Tax=Tellurirhabdus rosea TaxID=2674997 RepID=UPI00224EEB25|nr:molybdopterin-dependent oxidoreductase [Tellurirhabdus rosea]